MRRAAALPVVRWWRALEAARARDDDERGYEHKPIEDDAVILRLALADDVVTAGNLNALAAAYEEDSDDR